LTAKRLELLRELVPGAARVAVLVNPANIAIETTLRDVQSAASAIGLQIQVLNASTSGEIERAFAALARDRPDALFVGPDAFFTGRRVQLVNLSSRHAMPTAYGARDFAEAGGLVSYGAMIDDEIELGRLLDRDFGGLRSAQNLVHEVAGAPPQVQKVWPI